MAKDSMRAGSWADTIFKYKARVLLSQSVPTSGTKYTLLDTTKNVRIIGIAVKCSWTVQPTPLEIHLTIDGVTVTFQKGNPVTATNYYAYFDAGRAEAIQYLDVIRDKAFLVEARSIKIEAEVTGGTVQSMDAAVIYEKI